MFNKTKALAVLLAAFFLAGCGGSSSTDSPSQSFIDQNSDLAATVIDNYVDNVVIATYADLETKATALRTAVEAVNGGTQDDLKAAADAWIASRIPWEQSEAWLFGPVDTAGYDPALDSWPVNRTDLDAVLASDADLTEDYISNLDDLLKGFHTVEYLLFREGEPRQVGDLDARQLQYLTGTAKDIETTTINLHASWTTGGYGAVMKNAGGEGNTGYPSKVSAIEQIIAGMSIILVEVGTGKIADPYDEQDTELVESQFSFNSRADFAHDIVGVLNAYKGCRVASLADRTCTGTGGLMDLLEQGDSALAQRVEDEINAAIDAILAISQPFRDAITDSSQATNIEAAQAAIGKVDATLNGPVLDLVRQ